MADYWGVVGVVGSVGVIVVGLLALILMALKPTLGLAGTIANVGEVTAELWHTHTCYTGHVWRHSGNVAQECVRAFSDSGHALGACPFCTRDDALMIRGPHSHYCQDCKANWRHEAACTSDRLALCPWCIPSLRMRTTGLRAWRTNRPELPGIQEAQLCERRRSSP